MSDLKVNKLVVYNGSKDISSVSGSYSYSLGMGKVLDTTILNDTKKLNELALELRDEYSDFIYSLNRLYIDNNLTFEKLSLYFISDVSNKRTEFFDTFISICHIIIITQEIKERNIIEVDLVGCSKEFESSFSSVFPDLKINKKETNKNNAYNFYFLRQIKFFTKYLFNLIYFKLNFVNKSFGVIKNLFLTRYPMHFSKVFIEEKYGKLVEKDDVYLVSILTDGMHQGHSFIKNNSSLKQLKTFQEEHNIVLLDIEVTIFDLIKSFLYSFYLPMQFKNLTIQKFVFKEIDISQFLYQEINRSMTRIPRLLLYKNAIQKIFTNNKVENFYYYLHEYSYGKFFSYMLSQYSKNTKKIGFQHGPASMRKMLYFLSKKEVNYSSCDYKRYLPMPDVVLAEDEQSKKVYETANYNNVTIMKEVPRLEYLKYIRRENIEKGSVLVACGLHDGEFIFDSLKDEIKINPDKRYYFKLHPRAGKDAIVNRINEAKISNIEISEEHISKYLSFVEEVVFTYSSVGMEAYKLGIKVRTVSLPNKINESPILDYEGNI